MAAYELKYTAEEIDGILDSVDEKTIYGDATHSEHGLMSTTDKAKLDTLPDGKDLADAFDLKVDKKVPSTAGNIAKLTGEGNIADSGYGIDDFATEQQGRLAETAYQKPSSGIPKADLASSVQTSLGKADTALQEHQDISGKQDTLSSGKNIKTVNGESLLGSGNIEIQGGEENVIEAITMNGASVLVSKKTAAIYETDPTVPSWAKQSSKPSYDYSEISNTPTIPVVPTNVSAFTNDAGYLTQHQDISGKADKPLIIEVENGDNEVPNGTYDDITAAIADGREVMIKYTEDDYIHYLSYSLDGSIDGEYVFCSVEGLESFMVTIDNSNTVYITGSLIAAEFHNHGSITGDGSIITDTSVANGDKIVITDASASNAIRRSTISFDGSTTTKALTPKGTWETFYQKPLTGIPASDLESGVIPTVPTISTNISSDASDDTKTASPKAVKTYVDNICGDIQTILISI